MKYILAIFLLVGCDTSTSSELFTHHEPGNITMARAFSTKAHDMLINKMIPNLGNRDSVIKYHSIIMAYLEASDSILNIKQ